MCVYWYLGMKNARNKKAKVKLEIKLEKTKNSAGQSFIQLVGEIF